MKRNIHLGLFVFFVAFGLITQGVVVGAENSNQEFTYQQKKLSQVKEKNLRYKVAIGSFGGRVDIAKSLFNKTEEKVAEQGKTYTINIASPNVEKPAEKKTNDVAGLLSDLLRQTNMFDVVERQEVNQLVREIKFEKSDWVKKQPGNELGNIYGVQYVLLGDILPNKDSERFGAGQYTATLRLVDVNTGVIVASGTGQKNYLQDALTDAVSILADNMEGQPWICRIVRLDDKGVYINAGFEDKIEKNDVFAVIRLEEPIKDKIEDRILGYKRTEIAKIKIVEVMEKNLSLGKPFDIKESIKTGDLVSAKRVKHKKDNETERWDNIFGKDASNKKNTALLNPSSQLAKKSLPISSAEDIVNTYGKSIVLIQTDNAMGSGFVVSLDGLILTNSHVISGSAAISIKFIADNRVYSNVKVIKDNTIRDLALLKINDAGNFVPVVLGDSNQVSVGQRVVAIGNPQGLENTVSDGLVSAIRDLSGTKLLQISVPISVGSSGGPLFNMNGEVIGITSSSFDKGQNLNFAVAINHAKNELSL